MLVGTNPVQPMSNNCVFHRKEAEIIDMNGRKTSARFAVLLNWSFRSPYLYTKKQLRRYLGEFAKDFIYGNVHPRSGLMSTQIL